MASGKGQRQEATGDDAIAAALLAIADAIRDYSDAQRDAQATMLAEMLRMREDDSGGNT